jgi:hypothetical protein
MHRALPHHRRSSLQPHCCYPGNHRPPTRRQHHHLHTHRRTHHSRAPPLRKTSSHLPHTCFRFSHISWRPLRPWLHRHLLPQYSLHPPSQRHHRSHWHTLSHHPTLVPQPSILRPTYGQSILAQRSSPGRQLSPPIICHHRQPGRILPCHHVLASPFHMVCGH